ncbi:acyl carrier protein [Erwinia psidii]|nr:acyl carrier protein [Erwinia psidii]MCX8961168.1 acyl carrier protein [Erwinia psidii]MCX8966660.1 acyl carrier protein [Erwinia psidii]
MPPDTINLHDSLILDLEMDSVELIDLLIQLEGYGVIIDESQITSKLTAEQIAERLMSTDVA